MKAILIALFSVCLLIGCASSDSVSTTSITDAQEELTFIRTTLASQLNVPEEQLKNDVALGELNPPLDELGLVNLLMVVEKQYDITVPEEKLLTSSQPNQHHLMLEQNTLNKLAIIVHDERQSAEKKTE